MSDNNTHEQMSEWLLDVPEVFPSLYFRMFTLSAWKQFSLYREVVNIKKLRVYKSRNASVLVLRPPVFSSYDFGKIASPC